MAGNPQVEHLMRRAGFGMSPDERARFSDMSTSVLVDHLVDFERQDDDVDASIGQNAFVGVTTRGQFSPNTNIEDARQRWLFRMVHSRGRCRRRWRSSGTTTSPPRTARWPASSAACRARR